MASLTRILGLAAAGALVALTAASIPARADEATQNRGPVRSFESSFSECQLLKRTISRRACQARVWHAMQIDTAEK